MNSKSSAREYISYFPGCACIVSRDDDEKILCANEKFIHLFGCASESDLMEHSDCTWRRLVAPEDYEPLANVYHPTGDAAPHFHFRGVSPLGTFDIEALISEQDDAELGPVWSIFLVRSHVMTAEGDGESPITGLLSRGAFYQTIARLVRQDKARRIEGSRASLYINIANFKAFNSIYGLEKGDALLKDLAEILVSKFTGAIVSHFAADHFAIVAPRDGIEKTISDCAELLQDRAGSAAIALKAGIVLFDKGDFKDDSFPMNAFDFAKLAADSIHDDAQRTWAIYDKAMGRALEDKVYVLNHFEDAMRRGHIKPYLQPVVRTLTGKLCGFEALARWEDPVRGLIFPSVFIPVLEEARLIPKLDSYIIDRIGRIQRKRLDRGLYVLPISFNLSRVDFDTMDPFAVLEHVVARYRLPREIFRVEVTESSISRDPEKLRNLLEQFSNAGYECWLDDFGSGESSLNVLQNYHFDEIKLDMNFMKNFNENSQSIIEATVVLAKKLGIHTLAEGVETEEQIDFLRSIGCEKIQGYYYGSPMDLDALNQHLRDRGMEHETPQESLAYEAIGLVNLTSDEPISLFKFDAMLGTLTIMQENDALVKNLGHAPSFVHQTLTDKSGPIALKLLSLVRKAAKSGEEETLVFVVQSEYLKSVARIIYSADGIFYGQNKLYNISFNEDFKSSNKIDALLRNMLRLYDGVYSYHSRGKYIEVFATTRTDFKIGDRISEDSWRHYGRFIHHADRARFQEFMRIDQITRIAREAPDSIATDMFRIMQADGSFRWMEVNALMVGDGDILVGIKSSDIERVSGNRRLIPLINDFYTKGSVDGNESIGGESIFSSESIMNALNDSEDINFYWKDKNRRFLGASKSFLRHYGMASVSTILGKTDEELGWHIDNDPFKGIEEHVLSTGVPSVLARGSCIVKGRPHTIYASKFPLYHGNEVAGLLGYFQDVEDIMTREEHDRKLGLTDPVTGTLSFRGMIMAYMSYFANYDKSGEDFIAILMHVPAPEKSYGKIDERRKKLLMDKVVAAIQKNYTYKESLGHIGNGMFMAIVKAENEEETRVRLRRLANDIHDIHDVDGMPVTLYLEHAMAYGSQANSLDELIHILTERLDEAEQHHYSEAAYMGSRVVFPLELLDSAEENVLITDMANYDVLYMNKATRADVGVGPYDDYSGKKCYQLLMNRDHPCPDCPYSKLTHDKFLTRLFHNPQFGRDYIIRHALIPWKGKDCHFEMATNLWKFMEQDRKRNHYLYQESAVNDILEASLNESNPERGIEIIISRTAQLLGADKVMILEEMGDGTLSCTYEWVREGIAPSKKTHQHLPMSWAKLSYSHFLTETVAVVPNVNKELKRLGTKETIPEARDIISGHLVKGAKSLGLTLVVNPSAETLNEASPLLATITRFLVTRIKSRDHLRAMHRMSSYDPLTGAYNRQGGFAAVARHMEQSPEARAMVIEMDVDNFKLINDVYGHAAGDEALKKFVQDADKSFGTISETRIIMRTGGDEFVVFCPFDDRKAIERAMDDFVTAPHVIRSGANEVKFHTSIGYAIYPDHGTDFHELITHADLALYDAKMTGKGRAKCYDNTIASDAPKTARHQLGFNITDVANGMPGGVLVYEDTWDGKILFANHGLVEMFDCDDRDTFVRMTGGSYFQLIHPSEREKVRGIIKEQISDPKNTEHTTCVSYHGLTATGRIIELDVIGHRVRHALYGNIYYVFLSDRSTRKRKYSTL